MSLDFVSEVDKKFFSNNLLLNEDWGSGGPAVDDLNGLLDVDGSISADHFMDSLPDDFGIPMLDDSVLGGPELLMGPATDLDPGTDLGLKLSAEQLPDLSDGSDSGLDCGSSCTLIKEEPLSPTSSLSSDSQDLTTTQVMDFTASQTLTLPNILPTEIKLESPPLTPDRDASNGATDLGQVLFAQQTPQPVNSVKIDFSNPGTQVLQATKLPAGARIVTGANGSLKLLQPSPATSLSSVVPSTTTAAPGTGVSSSVTQVLNSKVKIQPKPPRPVQTTSTIPSSQGSGKPLVLTPEEFAELTSQGILKFQPPANQARTVNSTVSPPSVVQAAPASIATGAQAQMPSDMKLVKRQQRMIKNRESACLSRKRKKEYLTSMEQQLQQFMNENLRLKEHNEELKKRIKSLQTENEQLKSGSSLGGHTKKFTAVLAVLFFLSLNLGPLSVILSGSATDRQLANEPPPPSGNVIHHSRTLMSFNQNLPDSGDEGHSRHKTSSNYQWPQTSLSSIHAALEGLRQVTAKSRSGSSALTSLPFNDLMLIKRLEEINIPVSMCPSYFNSSESERLMNELTGWVLGHKAGLKAAMQQQKDWSNHHQHKPKPGNRRHRQKQYAAPRKLKAALKGDFRREARDHPSHYEVQVFNAPDPNYQDLMRALHRRNDTFYVVSFRRDHLLLPATAHNQTMRPRMSLVMPAVSMNETLDNNIAMMQIDCEVMATKLLHVDKAVVPEDVADVGNHGNHTSPPGVDGRRHEHHRKWQQKEKWRQMP